jgi:hypothetical protein
MPYAGEHAARIADPKQFDEMRRKNDEFGPGIDVIYGIAKGKAHVQAIRFAKDKFTPAEAKKWLKDHDYSAIEFENAIKENAQIRLHALKSHALRTEMFEGREHVVVPLILLVEGVHEGSGGPVYYPPEELADTPEVWDGTPITVGHPIDGRGNPVSAQVPQVLETRSIGRVFHSSYDPAITGVRAEGYIDKQKTIAIDGRLLAMIENGDAIELSTGVFTNDDGSPGNWKGEKFAATATNYRPNHVALLPDAVGACSVADGCGVRLNQEEVPMEEESETKLRTMAASLVKWLDDKLKLGISTTAPADSTTLSDGENCTTTETTGTVTVEVNRQAGEKELVTMEKQALIEKLINCPCTRFTANDAEWLGSLEQERLESLQVPEGVGVIPEPEKPKEPEPEKVADNEGAAPAAPMTMEQFIASAPVEYRAIINRAVEADRARKDALIKAIKANARNKFPDEVLASFELNTLEQMAHLADVPTDFTLKAGGPKANVAQSEIPDPPNVFEKK